MTTMVQDKYYAPADTQVSLATRIQLKLIEFRMRLFLLFVLFYAGVGHSFAQVELTIDTDALFTQANTWIGVFDDVYAIGIGISIAIAVLSLIGYLVVKALKSAGKG